MTSTLLTGIFQPSLGGYSSNDVGPRPWLGMVWGNSRLPTDPIGTYALTLENVPAGSRVHIEDQLGTTTLSDEIATGTAGTFVTYNKTLQVYAGGSPLNNWRIKVRKASAAPYFRPYETLMTATVGGGSIYVSMIQDD